MSGLPVSTQRIARAVAATLFDPGTGERVPEPRLEWMAHELSDFVERSGPRLGNGLRLIFLGLQLLPLFVLGKLSRFTSLGFDDRLRCLHRIDESRLLTPLLATAKIVLSLVYFEHPDVLPAAGINPGCMHPPAKALTPLRNAQEVAS